MSHVSTTIVSGSGTTTIVINKPTVSVGDILRVSFYFSANMVMNTPDAAFTFKDDIQVSGSVLGRYYTYYRRIDGTESSTSSWVISNTFSWRAVVQVIGGRIRSGDPYLSFIEDSSTSGSTGATPTVGLSSVTDHCDLVCDYTRHSSSAGTGFLPPSGMTEQADAALMGNATELDVAAGNYTGKSAANVGGNLAYPKIWLGALKPEPAPGVPTSVTATVVDDQALTLSWGAPGSGGVVDHYEVRIDGGSPVTATSPHDFTGLDGATTYDLEVRAVGPALSSSWVLVTETTAAEPVPTPPGYYRVALTLGAHSWDIVRGDAAGYGPTLPLTLGWDISDNVDFFPAQADLTTLGFGVRVPDAADLADVVKGDTVTLRMYVDNDLDAEPWQTFDGIVTQLEGETLPSLDPDADEGARDFRLTVFAADDNARLAAMFVGYGSDWPIESISDRVDRICTEAGIDVDDSPAGGPHGLGMVGWLPARPAGVPISALNAIQQALRDAADDYDSEPPDHYYGRYVFAYNHEATDDLDAATLSITVFRRRLFDPVTLDGGLVHARGARWAKQPGPAAADWVIVDGTTYGTPGPSVPAVRNTGLLDYFGPGGLDPNYSAVERDNLGESLLPDGSTALDGWAARTLRYAAYVDPDPVALWPSQAPPTVPQAVVITPISDELEVNSEDYLAGTLTGARLVIAPGGRFYVDLRLRSELLPGTDLP